MGNVWRWERGQESSVVWIPNPIFGKPSLFQDFVNREYGEVKNTKIYKLIYYQNLVRPVMGLTVLGEPGNVYAFVCAVGGGEEAGKYKKTRPG